MTSKQYTSAIDKYTEAIAIDGRNPVYFSNRAAAYSSVGDHQKAVDDAEAALDVDGSFVKAYSRLGHAHYSLAQFPAAVEAYEKGLLLDPTNANLKAALANAQSRLPSGSSRAQDDDEESDEDEAPVARGAGGAGGGNPFGGAGGGGMPDLSALAGMFGGGAGGAGGGGMPDIASLMQNPQMMAMAQQMMASGGLDKIMQNPNIRSMCVSSSSLSHATVLSTSADPAPACSCLVFLIHRAEKMQNGGGMPDMSELMKDPSLRELAGKFGGPGGAGGQ